MKLYGKSAYYVKSGISLKKIHLLQVEMEVSRAAGIFRMPDLSSLGLDFWYSCNSHSINTQPFTYLYYLFKKNPTKIKIMPLKCQKLDQQSLPQLMKENKTMFGNFPAFYKKIQIDTEGKVLKKDHNSATTIPSIYKKIGKNSWKY